MAKRENKGKKPQDPVRKELEAIKKLLIFFLLKTGVKAGELASVLEMDPSDFSRMIPVRKMKIEAYDLFSQKTE